MAPRLKERYREEVGPALITEFGYGEAMPASVSATVRGNQIWEFLARLLNAPLPRIRDFQGVSPSSFDGRGNFSLGIREQLIFPEIEYDKIDRIRGLQVNIATS